MSLENTNSKEQTGGWLSIGFASVAEIIDCPSILTNENANLINVIGNEDTLDVLPVPERFVVNATPSKNKSGILYNINISFDFPYQSAAIDSYLKKYITKKGIVFAETTNNKVKVFGSKTQPLDFSYQEINGKKLEDSSLTRVTIKGLIPQKPVYLSV